MKVPNRVLTIVAKLATDVAVSVEDKAFVLLWAKDGQTKRAAAAVAPSTNVAD